MLIIYNTYILASYRFDLSMKDLEYREKTDVFFVAVFTAEIFLKLIGLGWKGFRMDSFNIFDSFIVVMGYIEIGFSMSNVENPFLESLRALRALRMLKLARFNVGMRKIMK